jgi:hypothetical protein
MGDIDWDYLINMFDDGMIFVVDASTFEDVVDSQLFGLPLSYLKEMKLLNPGRSALFFFERNAQTISGLFTPSAKAQANINTGIWKHRNGTCKFPAQIPWRSVHKLPTVAKSHPKLPRFIRNMKIKGKYLDCLRLRELLISFRNICCEGPSLSGNLPERREKSSRKKRLSKGQRYGNESPDWDYYNERRTEYEHAMASYSDSQSSEADQEYSRSPTWSWDYGDEEDDVDDQADYSYPEEYERSYKPPSRSHSPHTAPTKRRPRSSGHDEHGRLKKGASYYRDHHGGYTGAFLGPQCAVDHQLTMDTADFMDFHMRGSAATHEYNSAITEPAH